MICGSGPNKVLRVAISGNPENFFPWGCCVPVAYLLTILAIAVLIAFFAGKNIARVRLHAAPAGTKMHSRPAYSGAYLALWTALPALALIVLWSAIGPVAIQRMLLSNLPASVQEKSAGQLSLTMSRIAVMAEGIQKADPQQRQTLARAQQGLASQDEAQKIFQSRGIALGSAPEPFTLKAAFEKVRYETRSSLALSLLAGLFLIAGFVWGYWRLNPRLRARNAVERVILWALIGSSAVAVLTTIGIVWSMLFETLHFFQSVSPIDFFFGTVWDPRFSAAGSEGGAGGQFGLLPLAWGTLYISLVALLVAVPVGLFAAIYMAEYASRRTRNVAKPLLEVLAGIPTIVYGFFALVTFGPFLRTLGSYFGLTISGNSVLTAGIVMGVMIIPFVSSLSDDIITAVPQSLREGSLGLGATKSETIRQVVLPAALPGIVGAVLLAASRAIGETMIVVLAAGIAANLTINPGAPVTTITVKIVSQLTGDLEFDSPQTLVAFALGLTLFVVTLGLNIYALYIVRKYKEQYD